MERLSFRRLALPCLVGLLVPTLGWAQATPERAILAKPVPIQSMSTASLGKIRADQPLTIAVSLKYRDPQGIERYVDAVSNPKSPTYRHFLTPEQVGAKFGPNPAAVQAVESFLTDSGFQLELTGKNGLTVIAKGTAAAAERAFRTPIYEYFPTSEVPGDRGVLYSFANPISLPKAIAPFVIDVSGLENFTRPQRRASITPNQFQTLYGVTPLFAQNSKGQGRTVGISNWDGFRLSGVTQEYNQFSLPVPPGGIGSNIQVKTIDGGSGTGTQQGEADLDIQAVLGVSPLCTLVIYDGKGGNLINVLTREANDNQADIITESWGWMLDTNTKAAAHNLHLSMSAQGITYMAASGDSGTNLSYTYPNVEPEVLMVGGTTCTVTAGGVRVSETGWSGSGGGWDVTTDTFNTLPSWQKGTGVPTSINRRLIPDIAADADPGSGYLVYLNGSFRVFGGTSGASPNVAGCLANAQQQLIKNGALPAVNGVSRFGRIQDLIYSFNGNPSIFFDVVSGNNGTLKNGASSSATSGWDFVTGWGAIDFNAFVTALSGSGLSGLTISPSTVEGGAANATGTVSMIGLAPSGGFAVQLSGGDSNITYPTTVTIPQGSGSATFTITTRAVASSTPETLTATDGTNTKAATLTLTSTPISTLTVTPSSVVGSANVTGTVTLVRNAPASGVTVALSGGDSSISYPATVAVAGGARTATFVITTSRVATNTPESISATVGGAAKTASFTLIPFALSAFTISPASIVSGGSTTGTVTVTANAPTGGLTVAITGGDSTISYPSSVVIPAGTKSKAFTISSSVVIGPAPQTLTATFGGASKSANLTVNGIAVTKLAFVPSTIYGGQSSVGTITISQGAGPGGAKVNLSGGDSSVSFPASVTVPQGSNSATFTVTSSTVATVVSETIIATIGTKSVSAALVVRPIGIISALTFAPTSTPGGFSVTGTLKLSYPAGPGGMNAALSGGDGSVTYPAAITVAAGTSLVTFTVTTKPVGTNTLESLTARFGSSSATGSFTLVATAVSTFAVSPTSVYGGQSLTGTVRLNGPAPKDGIEVALSGGDASVSYPARLAIAEETTSATFTISSTAVLITTTETLTAAYGGAAKSAPFTLKPAGIVSTLTFAPTSAVGGGNVTGTIKLAGPSGPNGVTVILSGGDSNITYPASVFIKAGATSATFTASLGIVYTNTPETITATISPSSARGTVTILATTLSTLTVAPTSVFGGQGLTGTAKLNGPAGTGGVKVSLSGGDASIGYPDSVTVAAGATTATFAVTSSAVLVTTTETLTGTFGVSKSATFTLKPAGIVSTLTFAPSSAVGGGNVTGTIKLAGPSGPNGVTVALSGGDSNITYPASVFIAAGTTSATFTATLGIVYSNTPETITATISPSFARGTVTILATALTALTVAPTSVYGGQGLTGTAKLNGPAGKNGVTVSLSGGDASIGYPSTVSIAEGTTTATFPITSSSVLVTTGETLAGTFGITKTAAFTLKPAGIVASLAFAPSSTVGGRTVTGTIKLSGPSGPSGVTVTLSGGDSNITYPSTVFVPAGATTATFTASLGIVYSNTLEQITATISPSFARGTVTILATALASLTVAPTSVYGGQGLAGTAKLNGPAGKDGVSVTLSGGDASTGYPTTVIIPEGATTATFAITSSVVLVNTTETLTGTFGVAKSTNFVLKPAGIVSALTFAPTSSVGGVNVTGTIKLTGPSGPAGVTVTLSGGDSSISYPATVVIPAGASSATFVASLSPVAANTPETITATISPSFARGTVTIVAPTLSAFTIAPTSVKGGVAATGTIRLTGVAPTGGVTIAISGGDAAVSFPATVTIPAGSNSATFTMGTSVVAANRTETLSVRLGALTKSASLRLTP